MTDASILFSVNQYASRNKSAFAGFADPGDETQYFKSLCENISFYLQADNFHPYVEDQWKTCDFEVTCFAGSNAERSISLLFVVPTLVKDAPQTKRVLKSMGDYITVDLGTSS